MWRTNRPRIGSCTRGQAFDRESENRSFFQRFGLFSRRRVRKDRNTANWFLDSEKNRCFWQASVSQFLGTPSRKNRKMLWLLGLQSVAARASFFDNMKKPRA
jgi:hypothetical protein